MSRTLTSRSPSSVNALFVKINVARFGTDCCIDGWMACIELFANINVLSRGDKGRLERVVIELSVRSMVSCWSWVKCTRYSGEKNDEKVIPGESDGSIVLWIPMMRGAQVHTFVTPRFSMVGILCPVDEG